MTRHAKNATAASVYTYHERRKDASVSGYGTLHERLGKDSMKSFDCCSLKPLISPQGHIFDREAILNYILDQKEAYKRKLKVWEQQRRIDEEKIENALKKEKDKMKEKLIALESAPLPQKTQVPSTPDVRPLKRPQNDKMEGPSNSKKVFEEESISNMEGAKAKEWKSFWVPVLSTTAEPDRIEKPSNKILCPISGVELKFKELLPVKFTPIDERIEFSKLIAMNERYICPISRDVLTNSIRCVYLKTSKSVVCSPCMEKIIRLDMIDPLCGKSLQDSDVIELSRGGTGYAATNDLKAKLIRPQLELQ
ncbi:unnamed protein product [Meloidogyne enterolobii]|uniref:Uncharacterized protein n=1 Tax=Meloidogyne enterolobii TaxID=390850 RepID=A0ACB1API3_MELEN